ncbi:MAG: hypothetical protein E7Z94_03670 [Actinomyces ruminicola]|nr:hypothetical protein [Actinomyces ruminicola]
MSNTNIPEIPYQVDGCPKSSLRVKNLIGGVPAPLQELRRHACVVGDTSLIGVGARRPLLELMWRSYMVASSLEETKVNGNEKRWRRSGAYDRMDPSEKGAISYFLGMVQCGLVAERVFGVYPLVHVDRVLELSGHKVPRCSRPDLVGYRRAVSGSTTVASGSALFEAKGRTNSGTKAVVASAVKQVKKPPREVESLVGADAIRVASVAHFSDAPIGDKGTKQGSVWRSHLADPDAGGDDQCDLERLRVLVDVAHYLPVVRAFREIEDESRNGGAYRLDVAHDVNGNDFVVASLLQGGVEIAIPGKVYSVLASIEGDLDSKKLEDLRDSVTVELSESFSEVGSVFPAKLNDVQVRWLLDS